jgi:hypothetical protein
VARIKWDACRIDELWVIVWTDVSFLAPHLTCHLVEQGNEEIEGKGVM